MMVAVNGNPSEASQAGLKDTLKAQNYFLICSCVPEGDITLGRPNAAETRFDTLVISRESLSADVIRLRLARPEQFDYLPGQFLTLYNDKGVGRSYSLASVPQADDALELHIRVMPDGQVSAWAAQLNAGDQVSIGAAAGDCSYVAGNPQQPLLLVGTGTGLAPLVGIARDALLQGHEGPIHLYHGSGSVDGLYLADTLSVMATDYAQFHYHPCVSRGEPISGVSTGRATDNALADFGDLSGWRVYLCGNEEMVKGMQKRVFLAGASMKDIFADPFVKAEGGEAKEIAAAS
jgi:NAD(P)H-flavin reductase